MEPKRVYILGAGCSFGSYPLAKDFLRALRDYGKVLQKRPNTNRLHRAVNSTVALMEMHQTPTIDSLALKVDEDLKRQLGSLGTSQAQETLRLEQEAYEKTLAAKVATAALFLDREETARRTGLHPYQDFVKLILDHNRDPGTLTSTPNSVLSFNYDRLFEIAFADHFRLGPNFDVYGSDWLNSGLDFLSKKAADIAPDRFTFLKLHGTAATWVEQQHGEPSYFRASLYGPTPPADDSLFWATGRTPSPIPGQSREPLIVFPHEKDRARQNRTSFLVDAYIRATWANAARLLNQAEEIWIIGYSFDVNDRRSLMELLHNSPAQKIIIQNPNAENIYNELRLRYPALGPRITALTNPF